MSATIAESAWLVRSPNTLWRRTLKSIVVLPPGAATPMLLSGAGELIWGLLDGGSTLSDTTKRVASTYQVSEHDVASDVAALICALRDAGAVEVSGS